MELAVDTSTRYAAVGLSRCGEAVRELTWRSERNHSVELAPAIREVMERTGVEMDDLQAVFVAKGPGAFSALRVGVSMAKAIAAAQGLPLVAVGTLDVEVQPYLGLGYPVRAVVDAGQGKLYVAEFGDVRDHSEYGVSTAEEVVSSLGSSTLLCGEGARSLRELVLRRHGSGAMVVDAPPPTRRPGVLAAIAYRRLCAGITDDPQSLQPIYIRGAQFERVTRRQYGT